jgi:hypothetical protein
MVVLSTYALADDAHRALEQRWARWFAEHAVPEADGP